MLPYSGMSNKEVVKFIKEGNMLSCPENTPVVIYELMRHCWNRNPSERPSFERIENILKHIQIYYNRGICESVTPMGPVQQGAAGVN